MYLGPEEGGSLYLGVEVEEGGAFCILRVGGRRIMTSKLSMQAYNLQSIDNSQFPSLHIASLQFPIYDAVQGRYITALHLSLEEVGRCWRVGRCFVSRRRLILVK